MAVYKLGAIVVTLSQLSGSDTMSHTLDESGAWVIITRDEVWDSFRPARSRLRGLDRQRLRSITAFPWIEKVSS